ncbi:EAL domain-containing protein, partial [Salmonella enterica subsp. enterica serovar Infantis]
RFMAASPEYIPAHSLAINLSPTSVCSARFPAEVKQLHTQYHVEHWQLGFEVTERNSLTHAEQAPLTLRQLQQLGGQIA